ncbi:MAG: leucine-rich repeat domain-containing protein [Prevotella sp.]|nr:leucine-rich repeat domain-containing protein [Prevotella sp.]
MEPGDYTIVVKDSVTNNHLYYSRIKNFELSTNWINVELATPGTLGYEALYTPGIDVLNDVEFIKVKGKMNDADWADIKNMQNLKALDISEAVTDAVPDNAFDGLTFLGSVILPETATTIGQYAFRNTTIRRINIPAAVTEIKQYAFQSTPLMYCTFSEGSQLKTIGNNAFQSCTLLQEIDLPALLETFGFRVFDACSGIKRVTMGDAVTNIGRYTFYNCKELESVRLSDAIETIYCDLCRENWALTEVHLPANLKIMERGAFYNTKSLRSIEFPDGLERIEYDAFNYSALDSVKLPLNLYSLGSNAFSNNSNLKYIEFPSYITDDSYWYWSSDRYGYDATSASGYRSNFQACPNIEKIVMRSATPPTVAADPFASSRDKTVVTLVVPSFAVVNYKLDTYWKQFGSIIEGDDVDYWKITSPLMLTNNRRMQGKPDVDLYYNGQLTVGGAAPMTMQNFNMFFSEDNPGRLLNTCDDMTADNITTRFSVAANRWYFITPVHDVNLSDVTVTNDASYVFRYYDAANRAANGTTGNNSWKNVDTGKLLAGQGYIFQCNKECMITLPAGENGGAQLFTTNDVTTNLATNEATVTANRSWNYVGNPYPCYYDIYYMDFTAPITVWTGSTYKAYSIADDEFVLRPMQSFFVQKPDAVDKIVFKKEGRQLLSTVSSHVAAGAKGSAPQANAVGARSVYDIVIAKANENEDCDQTRVVLNENANMGYEVECDASKFMSMNTGVPQIMTTDADGNHYAINERPVQNGTVTIGYYTGEPGEHVISLKRGEGTVTLTDNETGETTDLAKQAYTFQTNETDGVNTTRFTVTFGSAATSIIGLDSVETDNETATYDLLGRRVNVVKQGIYIQHSPEGRLQGKNGRKVVK